MVDDWPGMQYLPHARRVFSSYAQNHVQKFVQAKRLPHNRPHGYVAGFFFGVTDRNRLRQRHHARIRGERLKCRYENVHRSLWVTTSRLAEKINKLVIPRHAAYRGIHLVCAFTPGGIPHFVRNDGREAFVSPLSSFWRDALSPVPTKSCHPQLFPRGVL